MDTNTTQTEQNEQNNPGFDHDIEETKATIATKIEALDAKRERLIAAYQLLDGYVDGEQVEYSEGMESQTSSPRSRQNIGAQGAEVQVQNRTFTDQEVPQNQDGSVDKRTKQGREQLVDEDVITLEEIDWNNLPKNADGRIDQRTKIGRALFAAEMLDDKGFLKQNHGIAQYAQNTNQQLPANYQQKQNRPGFQSRPTPSFTPTTPSPMGARPGSQSHRFD